MAGDSPSKDLAALRRLQFEFGADAAREKARLLARLGRARLPRSGEVVTLHDTLCFMRAYPDDESLLLTVERMLARFAARADLPRFREKLKDSGIAGTVMRYRFYWPSLYWLWQRWPRALTFAARDGETGRRIDAALREICPPKEQQQLDTAKVRGFAALERLRGSRQRDASWFVSRVAAWSGDEFKREALSDGIDASYAIEPARGTPSRTLAKLAVRRIEYQRSGLRRDRPDLRRELRGAPRAVRKAGGGEAEALLDLARTMMVTQARDLDAFAYADARTVQHVDCGAGLGFTLNGIVPARRVAEKTVLGFLVLKNGVPIGYGDLELRGDEAAVAFNTFPAYRGGEAAWVFARLLAVVRHVLGMRRFSLAPYQLGHHNEEAVASGAWWFYVKLGFAPRDAATRKIYLEETRRMKATPGYRSSAATLRRLARTSLYFSA